MTLDCHPPCLESQLLRHWSLAILDSDQFKLVNDVHGHAAGDEALRAVAHVCTSVVRKCDSVSRWGGDEYVLLLRDADPQLAQAAVERARIRLASTPISVGDTTFILKASMGVASHQPGEEASSTLLRADRALYDAKAAGRNTVRIAP